MFKKNITLLLICSTVITNLQAAVFNNATGINIVDNAVASLYPSPITVSGMSGNITNVTVTINGLTHAYIHDVSFLLQAPSGASLLIQSGAADANTDGMTNVTYTLADAGATQLSDVNVWSGGTYKPTSYFWDMFDLPAPLTPPGAGTYNAPGPFGPQTATFASTFNGVSPNGVWKLFIQDFAAGDGGIIAGGWSLNITTGSIPLPITNFNLVGTQKGNQAILNWNLTEPRSFNQFDVQHSIDKNNYTTVGGVAANGSLNYNFNHEMTSNAFNYYRIKILNQDGAFQYSDVLTINNNKNSNFSIYPTVVSDVVNMSFENEAVRKINIVNCFGQTIYSAETSDTKYSLFTKSVGIPVGIYGVIVTEEAGQHAHRILIVD